jgi:hypothetical protein
MNRTTLATMNTTGNHVVQITDQSVKLMDTDENGVLLDEFVAGLDSRITIACTNSGRCAISTGEGSLTVLEYKTGKLVQTG